eukprot:1415170-Pyramimonas_sp.AAC.1
MIPLMLKSFKLVRASPAPGRPLLGRGCMAETPKRSLPVPLLRSIRRCGTACAPRSRCVRVSEQGSQLASSRMAANSEFEKCERLRAPTPAYVLVRTRNERGTSGCFLRASLTYPSTQEVMYTCIQRAQIHPGLLEDLFYSIGR